MTHKNPICKFAHWSPPHIPPQRVWSCVCQYVTHVSELYTWMGHVARRWQWGSQAAYICIGLVYQSVWPCVVCDSMYVSMSVCQYVTHAAYTRAWGESTPHMLPQCVWPCVCQYVTHMSELYHTYEWVVTHENPTCKFREGVVSKRFAHMPHTIHKNHTWIWGMSRKNHIFEFAQSVYLSHKNKYELTHMSSRKVFIMSH